MSNYSGNFDYQVGGSLPMEAPTYVVRAADRHCYQAIQQGNFCYVLNPRQTGKSSLMVRMMYYFQAEGFLCAAIDMTRVGSDEITIEQWYKGLAVELWRGFTLLDKVNLKTWWKERLDISPVQRLGQFIQDVLLEQLATNLQPPPKLIIFIDEIDSILSLKFPLDDFFALIRSCYNQRCVNPSYQRLTFALFGVATPQDLLCDPRKSPFNMGLAIKLTGFQVQEAQPLVQGLIDKVDNPQLLLQEIINWTNGQPFLTQKICYLIRSHHVSIPSESEAQLIESLIRSQIINNWESKDEPEHLRTIRDRLLRSPRCDHLLTLYRRVLEAQIIEVDDTPVVQELLLSGLVIQQEKQLVVQNRIYQEIFTIDWLDQFLSFRARRRQCC